jgi:K+-sensing histidine kinase KdpD
MVPLNYEPNGRPRGEYSMRFVKGAVPFAVTLVIVAAVTAILLYFKLAGVGPHHPVFFYLLPITLVAILLGSAPATMFAIAAIPCGAFFLYDPVYSFRITNPLELGDLICFSMLALIAVKCTVELLRPAKSPAPTPRPRLGQP